MGFPETHSSSRCCSRWTCRGHCRHDCWMWLLSHSEQLETPLEIKRKVSTVTSVLLKTTKASRALEFISSFSPLNWQPWRCDSSQDCFPRLSRWVQRRQHSLSHGAVIWSLFECFPIVTQVLELKYSNNYLAYLNSQNSVLTAFWKKNALFLFPLSA